MIWLLYYFVIDLQFPHKTAMRFDTNLRYELLTISQYSALRIKLKFFSMLPTNSQIFARKFELQKMQYCIYFNLYLIFN